MSNNTKLTLCPCLLIQQAMTQLFMWRQREGKAPACLWLSNQATGPIAAQRRKRDAGNDYCMTKSVYSLHIQIRRVGSINESQMARICPFFFLHFYRGKKWHSEITEVYIFKCSWNIHAYIVETGFMLSERAAVIPGLMQSAPLVALRGVGNVFSTASSHLENDIVHQIKWGRSNHNSTVGMHWSKG